MCGCASVAVLALIPSSVAGAGGELGLTRSMCHQPQVVPNCAALATPVAPALPGGLPREAGDAQWDTRSQDMARHLPRSSLWGPCLGKLVAFGSLLQSPDPAVNSIKAMLGKRGINYSR